jgi:hypothetical protein
MFQAIASKIKTLVTQLLRALADVGAVLTSGDTPLHLAARLGYVAVIPLLIRLRPAMLKKRNAWRYTPFFLALAHGHLEAAAVLLDAMVAPGRPPDTVAAAVHRRDPFYNRTALHFAASAGSQQLVAKLVEAGADREALDDYGCTPLHLAAAKGHVALVPLLATPTNINLPTYSHHTPLCMAAGGDWQEPEPGRAATAAALLAAGAALGDHSWALSRALELALPRCRMQVVRVLLQALAERCLKQQEEQQELGTGHHYHQQQQQQQKQKQQPCLLPLEIARLVPHCWGYYETAARYAHKVAQLLEAVLDVLGPQVAAEVCREVRKERSDVFQSDHLQPSFNHATPQLGYLAEALLLGWVGAVEQLHAARQPVVARLQRLVLGVHASGQQEQETEVPPVGSTGQHVQQQGRQQGLAAQLEQLVKEATLAAAAGQEEEALGWLGEFASLHLASHEQQQQQHQESQHEEPSRDSSLQPQQARLNPWEAAYQHNYKQQLTATHPISHGQAAQSGEAEPATLKQVMHQGLLQAAQVQMEKERETGEQQETQECMMKASCFLPPGVYTTFLAAWVGARRQLQQQLPQEVAATVVAAVKAARQQQQVDVVVQCT